MGDETISEILNLLQESREYARYFGELGAETTESTTTRVIQPVMVSAPASVVAGSPNERKEAVPSPKPGPERFPSAKMPALPTTLTSQESLFGGLAPPKPSFAQSN